VALHRQTSQLGLTSSLKCMALPYISSLCGSLSDLDALHATRESKVRLDMASGALVGTVGAGRTARQVAPLLAKWLTVASGKGGNGKTSTSLNLAVFAAHAGLKVCLTDLDSQRTLSRWHDRRPPKAPEIVLWQGRLTDARRAIEEIDGVDGLDLVIIDTPPSIDDYPDAVQALIKRSNLVLVPTTQGTADLDSVIEWMQYLRRERANAAFLLNRAQRTFATYHRARLRLNRSGALCPIDVRQLEDVQATHDLGVGVLEMNRSKAVEDYQGVYDFVCGQIGIEHR
jgi:chromosome partitioning protein